MVKRTRLNIASLPTMPDLFTTDSIEMANVIPPCEDGVKKKSCPSLPYRAPWNVRLLWNWYGSFCNCKQALLTPFRYIARQRLSGCYHLSKPSAHSERYTNGVTCQWIVLPALLISWFLVTRPQSGSRWRAHPNSGTESYWLLRRERGNEVSRFTEGDEFIG